MKGIANWGIMVALLILVFGTSGVARADIIDIQTSPPFPIGAPNPGAQSFQPVDDNVSGAGLAVFTAGNAGHLGSVTTTLETALNGEVLDFNTDGCVFLGGDTIQWCDVFFLNPVPVAVGSTLFLSWSAALSPNESLRAGNNTYPNGQLYSGTTVLPNEDMGFRIWTDDEFKRGPGPGPGAVPEPASVALLTSGLLVCFGSLLKKRITR